MELTMPLFMEGQAFIRVILKIQEDLLPMENV